MYELLFHLGLREGCRFLLYKFVFIAYRFTLCSFVAFGCNFTYYLCLFTFILRPGSIIKFWTMLLAIHLIIHFIERHIS